MQERAEIEEAFRGLNPTYMETFDRELRKGESVKHQGELRAVLWGFGLKVFK